MKLMHRISARPVVFGVVLIGLAATMMTAAGVRGVAKIEARDWVAGQASVVRESALQTVAEVIEDLEAVAAFIETAPDVGEVEFGQFVSRIDGSVSQIGVAYSTIIPVADIPAFLAEQRRTQPEYEITELSAAGELVPVRREGRSAVYPIRFFASGSYLDFALDAGGITETPTHLAEGLDAGATPDWLVGIEATVKRDTAVVSDFMDIAYSDFNIPKAFFVTVPIHDDDGSVTGIVAAPMLDVLLSFPGARSDDVSWELASMEAPSLPEGPLGWTGSVDLPGVSWQLTVVPSAARQAALLATPTPLIVLVGLLATTVMALLAHLALQRRAARKGLERMQRLSDDKDRFLAAVSHEIRTPLTTVHGLAHELAERPGDFSIEEASSLLELVVEQADEVAAIVEDLLVAARTDIGKVSIHSARVDLAREVEEVLAGTPGTPRRTGKSEPAWADPRRVRQILRNLLTNVNRYGGSQLEIRFHSDAEWSTVTVADDGPPISNEDQQRIFDPYTSAHEGNPQVGSIGLGLFISRKLAGVMGGELEYRHDGQFSCFTLRLPRARSENPQLRAVS